MGSKAAQKKMCPAEAGLYEGPNTLPGSRLYRDKFRPPLRKTPRRGVRVTHGAQGIGSLAPRPQTLKGRTALLSAGDIIRGAHTRLNVRVTRGAQGIAWLHSTPQTLKGRTALLPAGDIIRGAHTRLNVRVALELSSSYPYRSAQGVA
jgi:hypothetical protein